MRVARDVLERAVRGGIRKRCGVVARLVNPGKRLVHAAGVAERIVSAGELA